MIKSRGVDISFGPIRYKSGTLSSRIEKKVKCTLVQALRLCTGRTAHRGSRCIALLFHDHGTRKGWGVSFTPRPLFTPGKDPVPIVQEAGWAPGPVWTGAENLAPTGIRSPDRPARSQSLYRLRYPAHTVLCRDSILGSYMWCVFDRKIHSSLSTVPHKVATFFCKRILLLSVVFAPPVLKLLL